MATPLRTLSVVLEATTKPMEDSLKQAEGIVSVVTSKMEEGFEGARKSMDDLGGGAGLLRASLAGLVSGVSLGAFLKFLHDANLEVVQLDDTSRRIGLTLERL